MGRDYRVSSEQVSFRLSERRPESRRINHRGLRTEEKDDSFQACFFPLADRAGIRSASAQIRGCDSQAGCAQCPVRNQMLRAAPNRISIPSMTLSWLIYTAYGEGMNTSATVTGGPDWVNQTAYAVEGLAHEPATQRQFQAMLRTLLEDRFGLKIRTETRSGNIYALVLDRSDGKLGPNVQPWDGTCAGGRMPTGTMTPRIRGARVVMSAPGIRLDGATMYNAADLLSLPVSRNLLGRVVQDRTGLTGRYRMRLEYKFTAPRTSGPGCAPGQLATVTFHGHPGTVGTETGAGSGTVQGVRGRERPPSDGKLD